MSYVVGSEIGSDFEHLLLAWTLDYGNVAEWKSQVLFSAGGTGLVFTLLFKALFTLGTLTTLPC